MRKVITSAGALMLALAGIFAAVPANASNTTGYPGCPSTDGNVSWGDAKFCPDPAGGRFHARDSLTDGYCVRVYYYSEDRSSWQPDGAAMCTTGQWVTWTSSLSKNCSPDARLYRGNTGQYFTIPSTAPC